MSAPRTGKPINFRLDPELAAKVEAAARMEGVTLAEWWQRAARQRLELVDDTLDLLRAANAAIRAEKARKQYRRPQALRRGAPRTAGTSGSSLA